MKLDILILTMPSRRYFLADLMYKLSPQIDHRRVSTLVRMCNPDITLGENRQFLRHESKGEYIVFIDDDDMVPEDYVSTIIPLLDGVDYIGFNVQCSIDGKDLPHKTIHSLKYNSWHEDEHGYYRDISHINPMRRELALSQPMEGGHGEDVRWADRMRGKVKTEHYIDRVMYEYRFRTRKNQAGPCPTCKSDSTVIVESGSWCNSCGTLFNDCPIRKSCLWI